jgi:hypothetical protein
MRAEEVVRYARLFKELMRGNVDVQSRARRSYRAVVMPTDALFAFGMLKLTSLIMATFAQVGYRVKRCDADGCWGVVKVEPF